MPSSFLRNHGYLLYNYVANMLTFSYPLRTGEQGLQGELGKKRNRENSEKKGNRGHRGTRGKEEQGYRWNNNICTHNL